VVTDIRVAIDAAIAELRDTISPTEPGLIAEQGVGRALAALPMPAASTLTIRDKLSGRHPARVEQTVYFACREAIQNAMKHAGTHARMTIRLSDRGSGMDFAAIDDGTGFDLEAVHPGVGLMNIRERVESAGGAVRVTSEPGRGTTVGGFVPDVLAQADSVHIDPADDAALRTQIVLETDAERLRIVRDLHDGAQQRLVALRVRISLATEAAASSEAERRTLKRLGADADMAIAELRDLARSLRVRSNETAVAPALRSATRNWPMEVRVRERNLGRHDQAVEQAIYSCVLEALHEARAQRGQSPGARAVVSLFEAPNAIHFVVRDRNLSTQDPFGAPGAGTATDEGSAGHLDDRAAIVGGSVSVFAVPGRSVVRGVIPIAAGI
jgi:signal transduction histidine kinase